MLPEINENMSLKEIMDMDNKLFDELKNFGFDICCAKMSSLKESCKDKGLNVNVVIRKLNDVVEEINYIEKLISENE
jgi:iron-sulfur cluster repair protein YtfE (RIC family)